MEQLQAFKIGALLCAGALALAGCGGSGGGTTGPGYKGNVTVPGISAAKTFSFGLSLVDQGRFYLADRSNASLDVFDTATNTLLAQVPGFTGTGGPNGIARVTGTDKLYVSDVDSVKVVSTANNTVVKSIPVADASGNLAGRSVGGGCYDADDRIMMFVNPNDNFATWFNTDNDTVIARLDFKDGDQGLGQCTYDTLTKSFLLNRRYTTTNPGGELDAISAVSVKSGAPAITQRWTMAACIPTGIALGPNRDVAIACDSSAPGTTLTTLIMNRVNGVLVANVPVGGADQIAFDVSTNRYYVAAHHWQSNGVVGAAGTTTYAPVLGTIDASARVLVATTPTGNNAHAVAVDNLTSQVYLPYSATTGSTQFANGGLAVYSTR